MHTYDIVQGFNTWNLVATVGSFILGVGTLMVLANALVSYRAWVAADRPDVGPDPWDARALEWSIQSPTPEHNFDYDPVVTQLDDWWYRKYQKDENGVLRQVHTGAEIAQPGNGEGVHLPAPSYWPIVVAFGIPVVGYGLIFSLWLVIPGALITLAGLYGWALEPADDLDVGEHHGPDDHGHDDGDDTAAEADKELESV